MKKRILSFLIIIISCTCKAQSNDNPALEKIIDNFFSIYEKNVSTALDTIFSYADKNVHGALPYIKDTLAGTIKADGGKYSGHELIVKKYATPSYCFYSYLIKYPIRPMRFNFTFYKPEDKWVMVNFSFDSNIGSEITELGKIDHVK